MISRDFSLTQNFRLISLTQNFRLISVVISRDDFDADDDDGELVATMSYIERTTAEIARLTSYFQECMCGITLEERQQNIRD